MIIRKPGETNQQWAQRCQAYAEQLEENNRSLRVLVNEMNLLNPRTNKAYKEEAEAMFGALAGIFHFMKTENPDVAMGITEGVIDSLGFNQFEIHSGKIQELGVYNKKE